METPALDYIKTANPALFHTLASAAMGAEGATGAETTPQPDVPFLQHGYSELGGMKQDVVRDAIHGVLDPDGDGKLNRPIQLEDLKALAHHGAANHFLVSENAAHEGLKPLVHALHALKPEEQQQLWDHVLKTRPY